MNVGLLQKKRKKAKAQKEGIANVSIGEVRTRDSQNKSLLVQVRKDSTRPSQVTRYLVDLLFNER